MSASHGCNGDKDVVRSLKEALKQRVGADSYRMWFASGVEIIVQPPACQSDTEDASADQVADEDPAAENRAARGTVLLRVRGQFALDRLRKNFIREIRGAAMQACGAAMHVELCLDEPPAAQAELPLGEADEPPRDAPQLKQHAAHRRQPRRARRGKTERLSKLIESGAAQKQTRPQRPPIDSAAQPELPNLAPPPVKPATQPPQSQPPQSQPASNRGGWPAAMTVESFVPGSCNQLAHMAMMMACQAPGEASPLFISGPTGCGKTHILAAIAEQLRRRHRKRFVMHLSAEQFTNDFISSVGNSGIAAFRSRYRDVDALLIDDVQFLGAKKATLRELLYTIETLANAGRPLVFSGLQPPGEIDGLSSELAGRMSAGLVCPIQPLDLETRKVLLQRWVAERCADPLPESMIDELGAMLAGDGRVISGVINLINTLQRMLRCQPTMNELRQHGGQLLRAARPIATLSLIEMAVCEAFQLDTETLRGRSQARAVSEPRMLAMYLSRQLTSSAYAEIAGHFGGKSHSTAIAAEKKVRCWLEDGKPIGRGPGAMTARDAIDRVEGWLRSG